MSSCGSPRATQPPPVLLRRVPRGQRASPSPLSERSSPLCGPQPQPGTPAATAHTGPADVGHASKGARQRAQRALPSDTLAQRSKRTPGRAAAAPVRRAALRAFAIRTLLLPHAAPPCSRRAHRCRWGPENLAARTSRLSGKPGTPGGYMGSGDGRPGDRGNGSRGAPLRSGAGRARQSIDGPVHGTGSARLDRPGSHARRGSDHVVADGVGGGDRCALRLAES